MGVVGIGVDIAVVLRFARVLAQPHGARLAARVLHGVEHEQWLREGAVRRAELLAGAWAAKEATFKSLSPERQAGFRMRDWYRGETQGRRVMLGAAVAGETIDVSISHDDGRVIAFVVRSV